MKEASSQEAYQYEIRIHGHVCGKRASAFNGLDLTLTPEGQTIISGPAMDQSALFGVLIRIRDFGIPLLSVIRKDLTFDKT